MKCRIVNTINPELQELIERYGQADGLRIFLEGNPKALGNKLKTFFNGRPMTVRTALEIMAEQNNQLAKELLKRNIGDTDIVLTTADEFSKLYPETKVKGFAGFYAPDGKIYPLSDAFYHNSAKVFLLHEILHYYTVNYLRIQTGHGEVFSRFYNYAKSQTKQPKLYGYTDEFEFLSELFTNHELIKDLASMKPLPDKVSGINTNFPNLFLQLWDRMMQYLGFREKSLYDQVFALGTNVIHEAYLYETIDSEIDINENIATDKLYGARSDKKIIKDEDRIIFGHPGIGKTFLRNKRDDFIDVDNDYKEEHGIQKILRSSAKNTGRKEDLEVWENYVRDWWNKIKLEAKKTNKKIFVSNLPILKMFPHDFDKVITMSKDMFLNRSKQRNDYIEGETEEWKDSLDREISKIPSNKVVSTDKYLSDIYYSVNQSIPLRGNEGLYKKYNLLNKNGTLKRVDARADSTTKWVNSLNQSPNYRFAVGLQHNGSYAIQIYPRAVGRGGQTNMLQRENDKKNLNDRLISFLRSLNVSVEFKEDLKDLSGYNALSLTDLIYKTSLIREDYKDEGLLRETAYVAYSFLGSKNKIRTDLISSIENIDNYREIYEDYKTKSPNLNDYKIRELIVIDFIADAIKNNFNVPKDSYQNRKAEYWSIKGKSALEKRIKYLLMKIKRYLEKIFIDKKLKRSELLSLIDDIAHDILNSNFKKFGTELSESQQLTNYERTISNDSVAEKIIKDFQDLGLLLTGSLSLRKQGTIYRDSKENLHDLDFTAQLDLHSDYARQMWKELSAKFSGLSGIGNNFLEQKFVRELSKNYKKHPLLNKIKEKYPQFRIEKAFSRDNTNVTISGKIDKYMIDIFFRQENNLDLTEKNFQDWEPIFEAKLRMGRAKDINDFANYIPFNTVVKDKIAQRTGLRHFSFKPIVKQTVITNKIEHPIRSEHLDKKITAFLNRLGIQVKSVNEIEAYDKNGNKVDAIAVAKIMKKVIEIAEGKAKVDTLGEEAAHFLIELLGDHPLVQQMMKDIVNYSVYEDTYNAYSGIEGYDENRIKKEAAGKLIAEILVKKELGEKTPERMTTLWESFWNYVKNLFKRISSSEISEVLSPFEIAASKILNEDISDLSFSNITDDVEMYELSDEVKNQRDELLKKLGVEHIKADKVNGGYYVSSDRRKVLHRVTDQVKRYYAYIFKSKDKEDPESIKTREAGIVLHKLAELIFEKRWNNEKPDIANIRDRAKTELRELKDFQSKDDAYFDGIIHKIVFDSMVKTIDGVINQINEIEDKIAKIHSYTPEDKKNNRPTAFNEFTVYNKEHDEGGTIDLMIVHSNGAVSIFDWKSMTFGMIGDKTNDDVAWYKKLAFDIQLNRYKYILEKDYGANTFAASRIVPINMRLNKNGTVKFIQTAYTNPNDEHLRIILSNAERTGKPKIDKQLDLLIEKRNALAKEFVINKRNTRLKDKLNKLDKVIHSLQLDKDVDKVLNELDSIYKYIQDRMFLGPDSNDYLTKEKLGDLMDYVNLLENYFNSMIESAREDIIKDPTTQEDRDTNQRINDSIKVLLQANGIRDQIIKDIRTKVVDSVLTEHGIDITKPYRKVSFLGRIFNRISQFDHPAIRLMNKLVKNSYQEAYEKTEELFKDLDKVTADLKVWAESNGMSLMDAFKLMYNKDTGMLYRKLSKKFFEDMSEAASNNNAKWFIDNTNVIAYEDDEGELRYEYTGKSKELYEKRAANMLEYLKKKYSGYTENVSDEIEKEFLNWRRRFDISFSKEALFNKANNIITIKEDNDTYTTKEWSHIQNTKALKDYYDFYVNTMSVLNDVVTDVDINDHFVANIQQTFIDKAAQTGEYGLGAMREAFLQSMQVHQQDQYRGVLSDVDGEKRIPLMFYSPVRSPLSKKEKEDIENDVAKRFPKGSMEYQETVESEIKSAEFKKGRDSKSIDLSKSLYLFANAAYLHSSFYATEDLMKLVRYEVSSSTQSTEKLDANGKRALDAFTNKVAVKTGISKDDAEAFDKFMDMYWYGIQGGNFDKTFEFGGRTYSMNKLYTHLMKYIAMKAMGLKPILAFGNIAGASANSYFLGLEGKYFNNSQLLKAYKLMATRDVKTRALELLFSPYAHSVSIDRARKLSASKMSGWLTTDQLFIMHRKGDEMIDNSILIAMLQNYGLNSEGKVVKLKEGMKSLYELAELKDDGIYIEGLSNEEFNKFRQRVKNAATDIKGSIPNEDKNLVGTSIFTASIMMFKNWMPGLINTRFSRFKKDQFDNYDVGRFSAAFAEFTVEGIAPKIKAFRNLLGEIVFINSGSSNEVARKLYDRYLKENIIDKSELSFEEFVELRNAKLRALGGELRMFLALLFFVFALRAALPDDKEDPARKVAIIGYRMVNRTLLEVSAFLDPRSFKQFTTNAIPQVKLLDDLLKFITNTFQEGYYDVTGQDPKKNKDRARRLYYLKRFFPVVTSFNDFLDLDDSYNPNSFIKN